MKSAALLYTLALLTVQGFATTISINFSDAGTADSTMLPGDTADAPGAAASNWNNVSTTGGATGTGISVPLYDNGFITPGTTVDFTTDLSNWRLGHTVTTGDDRMWKGYLDVQNAASVTVNILEFAGNYDVYVYFDGSNADQWRVAQFTIGGTTLSGEDSEDTSWGFGQNTNLIYQQPVPGPPGNQPFPTSPNNSEGNYVVFTGLTGSWFTINATPGATAGINRAPINGFQIVGTTIPEPSSLALLGLGGLVLLRRFKR